MNKINKNEEFEKYIHEVNIYNTFQEFCELNNIQDMKKEPQNVFRAGLKYIQSKCYYDRTMLFDHNSNHYGYMDKPYNYSLLLYIYNEYENLCLVYNKEISILDFSFITGIPYNTFGNWRNKINRDRESLNSELKLLLEKIYISKEATIEGSGKADLITMAKLNHYYDWNVQGIKSTNEERTAISVDELRERLGLPAAK